MTSLDIMTTDRQGQVLPDDFSFEATGNIDTLAAIPPSGEHLPSTTSSGLTIDCYVLGPLEVHRTSQPVALNALMLRRLLALLLQPSGHAVTADRLIEDLWNETPPHGARKTLHVYVRRLRQALGRDRIHHGPAGYALVVSPGQIDAIRFDDLITTGIDARTAGEFETADSRFKRALALWRGEPYTGLALPALASEVQRLTERWLLAQEEYAEVQLELGRHGELGPALAGWCTANPYRERLTACRMLALYRSGQPIKALEVYRECAALLAEELGVEPGQTLSQLHQAILREDPIISGLSLGTAAANPASTASPASTANPASTATGAMPAPRQLPADTPAFTGRRAALQELNTAQFQSLTAPAIIAISGTAGVGKTALAIHWAHQMIDRFPDGQLYVNLNGFSGDSSEVSPSAAIRRFIEALGVSPERIPPDPDAQAALYRSLLAGKRTLILLDNARDTSQVRPLLPGTPTAVVVITSRDQMAPLIAIDGAHPLPLDILTHPEARALLVRRLGEHRVASEAAASWEIISACARLPLALNIAAARAQLSHSSLAALAAELRAADRGLDPFDLGETSAGVRSVLSWSYALLTEPAARLFRLLGLHPGPDISPEAAASLAGMSVSTTVGLLTELTRANLLAEHVAGRYAFHDLLRGLAVESAVRHDDEQSRRTSLAAAYDYYAHSADAADRLLNPQRDPMPLPLAQSAEGAIRKRFEDRDEAAAWFSAERAVLLAAVSHAVETGHDPHAWQLAWSLDTMLYRQGHWHDLVSVWTTGIEAAVRLNHRPAQGAAHRLLAYAYVQLGHYPEAHRHFHEALSLHASSADLAGQVMAHHGLGYLFGRQQQFAKAIEHTEQALALSRVACHCPRRQANALNSAGWYHAQLGNNDQAIIRCERALALFQEHGDDEGQAAAWDSLGYIHHRCGRHPEAVNCYRRALALFREIGDHYVVANVLVHLGDVHLDAGESASARAAWQQALDILTMLDHPSAREVEARFR